MTRRDSAFSRRGFVDRRAQSWLIGNRRFFIALSLALAACAPATTGPGGHVNVAAIRHQIDDEIQSEHGDRHVTAMGKTTADHATVYTTNTAGVRQEENWVKDASGWKMEKSTAMN